MYYNESQLINYSSELRKNFNNLQSIISDIENEFNDNIKSNNWNSATKESFQKELETLKNEFDKVYNIFLNVNNYLEDVILNYQTFNNQINSTLNNSF